jgi:hypothetical protein
VIWDASHANEYLYIVPWAYPDLTGVPHVTSTTARVRIGTPSCGRTIKGSGPD